MEIAHRRLHNLRLNSGPLATPAAVVDWLGASQSQDFAGALWALGLRMASAIEAGVLRAYDAGEILRTHVLRPTWHFVTPADIRWLLALTAPRVHGANGTMYRGADLSAAVLGKCQTVFAKALKGGRYLTREALAGEITEAGIADPTGFRLTYMVMAAELDGVICSGPRAGKQFTYALLEERVPKAPRLDRDAALSELARRYFNSRGPASVHDFARWSGLTVTDARAGLEAVKADLEAVAVDGGTQWAPPLTAGAQAAPAAFLLSVYDEYVSGYKDRSAIGSPRYWGTLEALGNALHFIIVVDSQILGTWKRTFKKDMVSIELAPFRRLSAVERRAVLEAAERYRAFLDLSLSVAWA